MSMIEQYIREAEVIGFVHKVISCKCEGVASGWITAKEWLEENKDAMNQAVADGRVHSVQTIKSDDANSFLAQRDNKLRLVIVRDEKAEVPLYPVYESPKERDFLRLLFSLDTLTLDRLKKYGIVGDVIHCKKRLYEVK